MASKSLFDICKLSSIALAAALVTTLPVQVYAQNEISLEDYIGDEDLLSAADDSASDAAGDVGQGENTDVNVEVNVNNEQSQPTDELPAPVDESRQSQQDEEVFNDNIIMGEEENAAAEAPPEQEDALPVVERRRLRIETEGFDYAPERNVRVEATNMDYGDNDPRQKTPEELEAEIRREAFDAAITGLFPLKPENIRALLREYDDTKRAVEKPINGIPTPRVNVETVSLDPGVSPLALKTAVGHITTVNILDVTGAPWPIQDISWAGDFEVIEPEEGGHIIRITPMGLEAYGNMSIRLLTLKTPVTIMLQTSTDEVQYRVDARIPEYGPFAQAPIIDGGTDRVAGNALIMAVLDGTPPGSAQKLDVTGVDGRTSAYRISGMTYVRTPLTLLSPGWEQSVTSADGMNVYALQDTPVLLLSDKGRFQRASVREAGDLFDE